MALLLTSFGPFKMAHSLHDYWRPSWRLLLL